VADAQPLSKKLIDGFFSAANKDPDQQECFSFFTTHNI
jgi:hypothetical protein